MNIFKTLFKTKPEEPQVSELVTSFVKLVKENPKRFLFTTTTRDVSYMCRDKSTNATYSVCRKQDYDGTAFFIASTNISFLSDSELEYLYQSIAYVFRERRTRVKELKRQRLMRVYCK